MKIKIRKTVILALILALFSIILSACGTEEATIDIDAQKTAFAQTAEAQVAMTQAAQPTATFTLEPTMTPVQTETQVVETSEPTATIAEVGVTATATTAAVVTTGNDAATWRAQDPDDYTEFAPGDTFTVTWTLENTGTSTWTTDYSIMFTSGDQMDANEQVYLPYAVSPGTNVQISVEFKAPTDAGEYQSVWSLVDASETAFYTNFYIIVTVVE